MLHTGKVEPNVRVGSALIMQTLFIFSHRVSVWGTT